jgi:chemotaxis-related protein WspD
MRADIDDCWRRIGVAGDRTCPQLNVVGHCRNCGRYAELAVQTLDREPPEGHIERATELLARGEESEARDTLAVIVFRLADEWLALPAEVFQEAASARQIRPIPHRTSGVLLGLVNVRGTIQLCVSIAALLGIEQPESPAETPDGAGPRLLVIGRDGQRWAFVVDAVYGIHRLASESLLEVPATAAKLPSGLTKAIFTWRETHAGLLDDQRLFEALRRSVQ